MVTDWIVAMLLKDFNLLLEKQVLDFGNQHNDIWRNEFNMKTIIKKRFVIINLNHEMIGPDGI